MPFVRYATTIAGLTLCLLCWVSFASFPGTISVQDDNPLDKWMRVPFSGTITTTRTMNGIQKTESMTRTIKESASQKIHISGCKKMYNQNGDFMALYFPEGTLQCTYSMSSVMTGHSDPPTIAINKSKGNSSRTYSYPKDKGGFWVDLQVNPGKGLYRLRMPNGKAKGVSKSTMIYGEKKIKTSGEGSWDMGGELEDGFMKIRDKFYNPQSGMISGSQTYNVLDQTEGLTGMMMQRLKKEAAGLLIPQIQSATWTLWLDEAPGKLELEPDGTYETWLPMAPIEGQEKVPTISITATITEPEGAEGIIEFKLEDESREPGICLNRPRNDDDRSPDLDLPGDLNDDLKFSEDGMSARTFEPESSATLRVKPKDFGAYGKITATAKIVTPKGELEVRGVYKKLGTPYVSLPKDEDDNSIADYWQQIHGVDGEGDLDEDDRPEGASPGDGLSLYEEYRGFFIQGDHQRLDPNTKDLFVLDRDNLVQGSFLPSAISPVNIHYPTAEEMNGEQHMKNYRVVNANHDRYHVVDQHGLVVVNESAGADGVWGICLGSGDPGPPRTADPQVNIYLDTIKKELTKRLEKNRPEFENKFGRPLPPGWLESHVKGAMGYIVAHECGHGIGIFHHRKTLPPGSTEDNVTPAQGWMMCTMRYLQGCNMPGAKDPYGQTVKYHDDVLDIMLGVWPWPNTYCNTMDDCKSQIKISDAE